VTAGRHTTIPKPAVPTSTTSSNLKKACICWTLKDGGGKCSQLYLDMTILSTTYMDTWLNYFPIWWNKSWRKTWWSIFARQQFINGRVST